MTHTKDDHKTVIALLIDLINDKRRQLREAKQQASTHPIQIRNLQAIVDESKRLVFLLEEGIYGSVRSSRYGK